MHVCAETCKQVLCATHGSCMHVSTTPFTRMTESKNKLCELMRMGHAGLCRTFLPFGRYLTSLLPHVREDKLMDVMYLR